MSLYVYHHAIRTVKKLTISTLSVLFASGAVMASEGQPRYFNGEAGNGMRSDIFMKRLGPIKGDVDKTNDVIFCGSPSTVAESNVVFFGGDVQDYKENMMAHRDNHRHKEWNLEATAQILQKRFPRSDVWVIKPSRMHLKTFSVYQNFVNSNDFGAPTHDHEHGCINHLNQLLQRAIDVLNSGKSECKKGAVSEMNAVKDIGSCDIARSVESSFDKPIILVAFSKGCIVLNQFLYELEKAKTDSELNSFIRKIHSLYWLDGGHPGGSNTWIVHQFVLKNLIGLDVRVFAHVTPYQIHDEMRAWIGKEERKFVDRLKKMNINVTEVVHFEDEERSLDNHFMVLLNF